MAPINGSGISTGKPETRWSREDLRSRPGRFDSIRSSGRRPREGRSLRGTSHVSSSSPVDDVYTGTGAPLSPRLPLRAMGAEVPLIRQGPGQPFSLGGDLPPELPSFTQRADWRWWREWPVKEEINREIASVWSQDIPLEDRVRQSSQALLRWRVATMTNRYAQFDAEHLVTIQPFFSKVLGINVRSSLEMEFALNRLLSILPRSVDSPSIPSREITLGQFARMARIAHRDHGVPRRDLREAFHLLSAFRQLYMGTWGAYSGRSGEIWVNPPMRVVPHGIGTAAILAHELGGHMATNGGASGPVARAFHWAAMNPVTHLLDPLTPVTERVLTVLAESEAIGAEWEYLSRIPEDGRTTLKRSIEEQLGEHRDLLRIPRDRLRQELRSRFKGDENLLFHGSHVTAYHSLEIAGLPKPEFIRRERHNIGYAPSQQILKPIQRSWRWARHEEYYRDFIAERALYVAKLGLYGALTYLGYQWLASDD